MRDLDRSLIAGLAPFEGLNSAELDRMLGQARARRVAKDRAVFEQEQQAQSFFLLLDGYVRVIKTTLQGEEITVRYISPGELIGIASALSRTTYPASVTAIVDCVLLSWPSRVWPEFASAFPSFGANTYRIIGTRLQDAHARMIEMSTEQVDRRVAHALLKLVDQSGKRTAGGLLIDFPLSRQDIAEMTGTILHTVSRVLAAWGEKGLVRSGRQKVTIVQPIRLRMLAEGRTQKA